MPVAPSCRSANRNKDRVSALNGAPQINSESQAPRINILGHQHIKAGFKNWNLPLFQICYFVRVFVHANNIMTEIRKTDARDQSNISCSDHCDFH